MPDHYARLEPSPQTWTVTRNGVTVAESAGVVMLHETYGDRELPPVPYFPPDALRVDVSLTEHHTTCPIKGQADYLEARVGEERLENAIWLYPDPVDDLAAIAGYVAFYGDRFEVTAH